MQPDRNGAIEPHVTMAGVHVPVCSDVLEAAGILSGSEVTPDMAIRLVILEGVYQVIDASLDNGLMEMQTSDLRRMVERRGAPERLS